PHVTAKFDLLLFLTESTDELNGTIEYSRDLFEESTVRRLAGHLIALLEAVTQQPDRHLSELTILPAQERELVVAGWGGPRRDGRVVLVEALVGAQVARTPGAVAVSAGGASLTYEGLWARSGRLAMRLRASGVGVEDVVGVCAERGVDLVVAL